MSNQNHLADSSVMAPAGENAFLESAHKPMAETIPVLETGDHLSRDEFERRYNAMPNVKKAELIEGIVYMPAAIRLDRHGNPHGRLITWLGNYEAETVGTLLGDNSSVRLDLENEPQPDCLLLIEAEYGGQADVDQDGYVARAPELVAEVSASTASIDSHTKRHAYLRGGVREYIVWRVLERAIDWFVLRAGAYERLTADPRGVIRSEVFPGLWLDGEALMRGEMKRVLATLEEGLNSDDHANFVASLISARKRRQANEEPR